MGFKGLLQLWEMVEKAQGAANMPGTYPMVGVGLIGNDNE